MVFALFPYVKTSAGPGDEDGGGTRGKDEVETTIQTIY